MYLTTNTKQLLENVLGISILELANMTADEEIAFIKKRTGKKPTFSKKRDFRKSARGNHLIVTKRIAPMEEIDQRIMGLKFDGR